jgi:hypothetical protein
MKLILPVATILTMVSGQRFGTAAGQMQGFGGQMEGFGGRFAGQGFFSDSKTRGNWKKHGGMKQWLGDKKDKKEEVRQACAAEYAICGLVEDIEGEGRELVRDCMLAFDLAMASPECGPYLEKMQSKEGRLQGGRGGKGGARKEEAKEACAAEFAMCGYVEGMDVGDKELVRECMQAFDLAVASPECAPHLEKMQSKQGKLGDQRMGGKRMGQHKEEAMAACSVELAACGLSEDTADVELAKECLRNLDPNLASEDCSVYIEKMQKKQARGAMVGAWMMRQKMKNWGMDRKGVMGLQGLDWGMNAGMGMQGGDFGMGRNMGVQGGDWGSSMGRRGGF